MEYMHYYEIAEIPEQVFEDAKAIVTQAQADGIALAGGDGTGEPVVSRGRISLNGSAALGEDAQRLDIPFALPDALLGVLPDGYGLCQTRHEPYDAVVVAILVSAFVSGARHVASDGGYGDWEAGIALYERATGRKLSTAQRKRLRMTLNREFRPLVVRRLEERGFKVTVDDAGHYDITDAQDGGSVAARGTAMDIADDARWQEDGHCQSKRLADALDDIVEQRRASFYRKNGKGARGFSWLSALVCD